MNMQDVSAAVKSSVHLNATKQERRNALRQLGIDFNNLILRGRFLLMDTSPENLVDTIIAIGAAYDLEAHTATTRELLDSVRRSTGVASPNPSKQPPPKASEPSKADDPKAPWGRRRDGSPRQKPGPKGYSAKARAQTKTPAKAGPTKSGKKPADVPNAAKTSAEGTAHPPSGNGTASVVTLRVARRDAKAGAAALPRPN